MSKVIRLHPKEKPQLAILKDAKIIRLDDTIIKHEKQELGKLISLAITEDLSTTQKRDNIVQVTSKYIDLFYPIIGTHRYSDKGTYDGSLFRFMRENVHMIHCAFSSEYRTKQLELLRKDYILPMTFMEVLSDKKYFQKMEPLVYSKEIEVLKTKYKPIIVIDIQKAYEILNKKNNLRFKPLFSY